MKVKRLVFRLLANNLEYATVEEIAVYPCQSCMLREARVRRKCMKYEVISADCHIDLCWLPPDLFPANAAKIYGFEIA